MSGGNVSSPRPNAPDADKTLPCHLIAAMHNIKMSDVNIKIDCMQLYLL